MTHRIIQDASPVRFALRAILSFSAALLLAGCFASSSVCDTTCLSGDHDRTLYVRMKTGETITVYKGLYAVALSDSGGTITGIGSVYGGTSPSSRWEGTISLTDVESITTQHFDLLGSVVAIAVICVPGILIRLLL